MRSWAAPPPGSPALVEVAAVHGSANASLIAGYGYAGIVVAFIARQNPLAIVPVAVLVGGLSASGGMLQRRLDLPDATVLVLQGIAFMMILGSEALYGRLRLFRARGGLTWSSLGWWGVPIGVIGGAIRVSTPFLFVSLGECITERSGRINLGLEGILVMGAMSGYAVSYTSGNPWLGVLAAGGAGLLLGLLHGLACNLPKVNDIAVGIGLMLFGTGLAFFLGKPYVQPKAPTLPAIPLGAWSDSPQIRAALQVNPLFLIGLALAIGLGWAFPQHALGSRGPHGRRQLGRRARHGLRRTARANARDRARRLSGRRRRLVPLTVLSGQLERRTVERSGTDGGGARDLRALEPDPVLLRRVAVRRRGIAGTGAPVCRRHVRLLSLQRRAVRRHARHHDRHVLAAAHALRRAGRAEHQSLAERVSGGSRYARLAARAHD